MSKLFPCHNPTCRHLIHATEDTGYLYKGYVFCSEWCSQHWERQNLRFSQVAAAFHQVKKTRRWWE